MHSSTKRGTIVKQPTRKPFVVPQLKEEASLEGVTLVSLGAPTRSNAGNNENLASRNSQGGRAA
jgi:hypothetical protein